MDSILLQPLKGLLVPKTKSKNYNRYTLEFKLQAVNLAALLGVKSKDIAAALGTHPIMLYRWSMEHRNRCLTEAMYMSKSNDSPKRIIPPKEDTSLAEKDCKLPKGCLFHSDQGIEYAAYEYQDALREVGLERSMSRKSTPLDNAAMKSYFHSLKAEIVHQRNYQSRGETAAEITAYMAFYNSERLHSSLGYIPPEKYEILNA